MPKIIENLENRLMEEAKKQIQEAGYGAMTIRSVAAGCGVGVGTVYNYFSAKEELIAACLLEDWNQCVTDINAVSADSEPPRPVALYIFDQLTCFATRHAVIFRDEAAAAGLAGAFSRYHGVLRTQLAAPLEKFCRDTFSAEFIAEALLTWTMAGKDFETIYGIIGKLF